MTDLLELWRRRGSPPIPISGKNPEAVVVVDLERFLAAGPGPLLQHQVNYERAIEAAWKFLRE